MDAAQLTFTINGEELVFVACPSRLGHIKKRGPVTGKDWIVKPQGSWMNADDAAELVEVVEDVWCFRLNDYLKMHTVFYLGPNEDQITKLKEANGG